MSALLKALNARLAQIGIYPERWLGHSFLWLDAERADDPVETLAGRFRLDIIPLIEEYCFADRAQMAHVLGPLVDDYGQPREQALRGDAFVRALRELIEGQEEPPA